MLNLVRQGVVLCGALAVGLLAQLSSGFAQKIEQVVLTEEQVVALISAQKDFEPLAGKLAEANDEPDEALLAELGATAKKHGFSSFDEYRRVDNNIFLVLEGLDRKTGEYTPPAERLKEEIEHINNDASISGEEKKALVEEINEEIAVSETVKHKENIELVNKHLDGLTALLPEDEDLPDEAPAEQAN